MYESGELSIGFAPRIIVTSCIYFQHLLTMYAVVITSTRNMPLFYVWNWQRFLNCNISLDVLFARKQLIAAT